MTPQDFAESAFRSALWDNPDGFKPTPTEGFQGSTTEFSFADVAEVIGYEDGENDGDSWLAVLRLVDGRFVVVVAGCDYSGWGCCSHMGSAVAASLAELVRWGLSPEERERLGLQEMVAAE
jgi:hypothetical protein